MPTLNELNELAFAAFISCDDPVARTIFADALDDADRSDEARLLRSGYPCKLDHDLAPQGIRRYRVVAGWPMVVSMEPMNPVDLFSDDESGDPFLSGELSYSTTLADARLPAIVLLVQDGDNLRPANDHELLAYRLRSSRGESHRFGELIAKAKAQGFNFVD